jgi:hypothetical protein
MLETIYRARRRYRGLQDRHRDLGGDPTMAAGQNHPPGRARGGEEIKSPAEARGSRNVIVDGFSSEPIIDPELSY